MQPAMSDALPFKAHQKRVLNGPECWNLEPFKYPWAFEMYLQMQANHWTPMQITMAKDLEQYKHHLTDGERHDVLHVLATLTTMDLMAAHNFSAYANADKQPRITAPEVSNTLFWQAGQETIHSWSYKVLLDTLQLDPDHVYNLYKTVPEIDAKIQYSRERMQHFSRDMPIDFVLKYFFFSAIFEGLWFYHGFSPVFALQRRSPPLLPGTGEQLAYIMRDEELHVRFGLTVIKHIIEENGIQINRLDVEDLFDEALSIEEKYIKFILREPILGYNVEDHLEHARYLANRRCRFMGWNEPYKGARSTLDWLDSITGGLKKEKNFFETHVTEYQSGGVLRWD